MRKTLLVVQHELVAAALQNISKPGVEVCYLGQEVDTVGIECVYLFSSQQTFRREVMNTLSDMVSNKISPNAEIRVLLV